MVAKSNISWKCGWSTGYNDLDVRYFIACGPKFEVAKHKVAIYVLTEVVPGVEVAIPRLAAIPLVVKHKCRLY